MKSIINLFIGIFIIGLSGCISYTPSTSQYKTYYKYYPYYEHYHTVTLVTPYNTPTYSKKYCGNYYQQNPKPIIKYNRYYGNRNR